LRLRDEHRARGCAGIDRRRTADGDRSVVACHSDRATGRSVVDLGVESRAGPKIPGVRAEKSGENSMADAPTNDDHYEVLQISPNAEPDTIHRVYRLLAQRFHPDNKQTGSDGRFRMISDAYNVLSDPAKRAKYDVVYNARRKDRWRLVSNAAQE